MTRGTDAALLALITSDEVQPFIAVEMLFDTAPVRFWSGLGDRDIGGETYVGSGNLMAISNPAETVDLVARSMTVSLQGASGDLLALAIAESYVNRTATVCMGDSRTSAVVQLFSGRMKSMAISDDAENPSISLQIESKLIDLDRGKADRYTDASQRGRYPADTFFSYITDLVDKPLVWGRKA